MAALSTHRAGGSRQSRAPRRAQASASACRSAPLAATPPTTASVAAAGGLERGDRALDELLHDRRLKARGEVGARLGQAVAELAHAAQQRRLEAREREIVTVLSAQHGREREARGIAVARDELERGTPGVTQPEQARALVERLARRVVARAAEPHRRGVVGHVEHERVPAGGQQARERRSQRERREPQGGDVAEQVVDRARAAGRARRPGPWPSRARRAARRSGRGPA